MSDKIARKQAELDLLIAEAEFIEKKQSGELTNDDRLALRELRQAFRDGFRQPTKDGAAPKAIGSKAKAEK